MPAHPPSPRRASLAEALQRRERDGRRVRVGVIGCGQMGTDLVVQIGMMPGMEIVAIADGTPERVEAAVAIADDPRGRRPEVGADAADLARLVANGRLAVTRAPEQVCALEAVDVVIDATGSPNAGAAVALAAIEARKHVVMMNVEADITAGSYFAVKAAEAGVVYTIGAGDEPSSTFELITFVRVLGYPVVAAGKGKNNPFNVDAVPSDYAAEAKARNMNPRMLVEFVDGSKTMVEMVAIANAAGLAPDVPGMHGPAAPLDQLHHVFCPQEDGGLLSKRGAVDFSVAKGVAPGVFCIAEMRHPRVRERMNDLKLGEGPYYAFVRPYHLTSLEVPLSAAAAVINGEGTMHARPVPTADVGCVAKRDLAPGETLDKIGEYAYRGFALTAEDSRTRRALPIGLALGAKVVKPVAKGALLTLDAVEPDASTAIYRARRAQDDMVARSF
jgi:predicted homoserine dehydrogenase-like protein